MHLQYNVAGRLLCSRAPVWPVDYMQLTTRVLYISHEVVLGLFIEKREFLMFDIDVGTAS
jgi:hypothetical protein